MNAYTKVTATACQYKAVLIKDKKTNEIELVGMKQLRVDIKHRKY